MIDTGNGKSMDSTIEAMTKIDLHPKNLTTVIITHEHLDHVLGLYALKDLLGEQKFEIKAHKITAQILKEGDQQKIAPSSLGISPKRFGIEISPLEVEDLDTAQELSFGDFSFKLFDTPGHSIGSMTLYDPRKKILFPGDVVFPQGSFGRYDFPGGSLKKLQASIGKLNDLDVDHLCSGHMKPVIGKGNESLSRSYKNVSSLGRF